jgi:hypothetical protein
MSQFLFLCNIINKLIVMPAHQEEIVKSPHKKKSQRKPSGNSGNKYQEKQKFAFRVTFIITCVCVQEYFIYVFFFNVKTLTVNNI